jgi:DNA helicase-2/ATP-dependent DNA helicase PcrA
LANWDDLSESQRAAVLHDDGPAAVYAGPGSGKTRVVTLRAARMAALGSKLLITTFTNDATEEMRSRLGLLLPKERMQTAHVTTMHALCLQILRMVGVKFQLVTDEFLRRNLAETAHAADLEGGVSGFLTRTSFEKNTGMTAPAYKHDGSSEDMDFARAWRAYEKAKADKGLKEFDDLILDVVALLSKDEALRRQLAARYTHITVDECQDVNGPQYAVAFALGRDHKNLMLVGDLDQSLYAFRGADTASFRHFATHPRTQIYELRENYRCTRSILTFADSLIRQDANRRAIAFVPTRPEGEPVTWQRYSDADVEALATGEQILRLNSAGVAFGDIAVLYRANAQSEALERHFAALGIPYVLREDGDFYARKEVQGLLAYLNFFAASPSTSPSGQESKGKDGQYPNEWLIALLNVPNRKLSRGTGTRLLEHAEVRGRRIWDILSEFHAPDLNTHRGLRSLTQDLKTIDQKLARCEHAGDAIRIIRAVTGFDEWLRRDETDARDNDRIQNIQRMQSAAAHYATIHAYLEAVKRVREQAERRKAAAAKKRRKQDEVTLCTGHSAKGLEWRCVYAIGWSEELLPHRKADNIDEERRIAYVIATRARDLLRISSIDSWNETICAPSRFLTGLQLASPPPAAEAEAAPPELPPDSQPSEAYGGLFMSL